jgi:hypothetical protein
MTKRTLPPKDPKKITARKREELEAITKSEKQKSFLGRMVVSASSQHASPSTALKQFESQLPESLKKPIGGFEDTFSGEQVIVESGAKSIANMIA